ncbi:hypothetical protein AU468_08755 [Alkalispirochaeta sphaeroplastigenens]|uniref:Uncharacterized protein n=2 Tax=Alkalispirochaeta TaxID=2024958 RepID=A0A2S4JNM3_9SPIO|nr:DUF3820 family protein [Alkalispirochaeta sphaeroplastigenens]POR01128.1 hypothetical protein AU468_08755 [Alkalispirochaeta sphaeroplastigenens]
MIPGLEVDPDSLVRLANARMPFGRYQGELLLDIPLEYILWFANRLPEGLGSREDDPAPGTTRWLALQFAAIHSFRFNGLEGLLRPLVDEGAPGESEEGYPEAVAPGEEDEMDWIARIFE